MTLSASVIKKLVRLLKSGELSAQELGVAVGVLILFDNAKTTYSQLSEYLHLSHNTIRDCLKALERLNIVRRQSVMGVDGGLEISPKPTESWYTSKDGSTSLISYSYKKEIEQILEDLNKLARRPEGKQFQPLPFVCELIRARLREGHTVADFKVVHRATVDWLLDNKMHEFFRPETLYRRSNFGKYLFRETKATNDLRTTSKFNDPEAKQRARERNARLKAKYNL